jgi:hypothetical protein
VNDPLNVHQVVAFDARCPRTLESRGVLCSVEPAQPLRTGSGLSRGSSELLTSPRVSSRDGGTRDVLATDRVENDRSTERITGQSPG